MEKIRQQQKHLKNRYFSTLNAYQNIKMMLLFFEKTISDMLKCRKKMDFSSTFMAFEMSLTFRTVVYDCERKTK